MDPNEPEEIRQVGALMAETFLLREPVSHALATSNPKFPAALRAYSQAFSEACAVSGLTPIAKAADGAVVGLIMAEHWDSTKEPGPPAAGDGAVRCNGSGALGDYKESKVVELTMGTVRPDFEGAGLADRLVFLALLNAYQHGYDQVMTKSTSNSRLSLKRAGFVMIAELSYQEYEYQGERPFQSIEYPLIIQLLWGDILSLADTYQGPAWRLQ
ncbi:hypothetical protein N7493_000098 [Penicillium malachiteum]|uniref:N-acetyltransferase domain-containing protein n=1 Tax=Penicillium malachiteum TaxID=1324776 RepID=A0AAD6HW99_9EURO|nr:hypothetical protein N7493_000098 [Penicillium malachiteum]